MCDLPTPLKQLCPDYRNIEARLWWAIADKFGVPRELHDSVKAADSRALTEEDSWRSWKFSPVAGCCNVSQTLYDALELHHA